MNRFYMKRLVSLFFVLSVLFSGLNASESGSYAFVEGCEAYTSGDWENAVFMFKKAVAYSDFDNPDTYFMLITAEVQSKDYKTVLEDCDYYLNAFPSSIYYSMVYYLKGKNLFSIGEYNKAVIVLSDFCHQFEKDDMYPYALYYIAEALYADFKYDEAKVIYERIVKDFPDCEKFAAAQYRIDIISQKIREDKLLYLLKQTGEEYLAAKEDYEKQLRLYNSDSLISTRQRLQESQQKNIELEKQIKELEDQIAELKKMQTAQYEQLERAAENNQIKTQPLEAETIEMNNDQKNSVVNQPEPEIPSQDPYDETAERIRQLKKKALEAQRLMNAR